MSASLSVLAMHFVMLDPFSHLHGKSLSKMTIYHIQAADLFLKSEVFRVDFEFL